MKSRTDDEFLLRFLRARKFDYDRAFALLLEYFTVRAKHRDIFQGCLPSKLGHVFDTKISMVLPNRDQNGHRMVFFRPGKIVDLVLHEFYENCHSVTFYFVIKDSK